MITIAELTDALNKFAPETPVKVQDPASGALYDPEIPVYRQSYTPRATVRDESWAVERRAIPTTVLAAIVQLGVSQ